MNVLVEMEIPKSCEECPFACETEGVSHDFCQYVGYESDIEKFVGASGNGRPRWCPFNYAENAVLSQEVSCGEMTQMQDQDCHYVSLCTREGSSYAAKKDYDDIRRLRQKITKEEKSSTCCETCKNYEGTSYITGWCSACPGTVIKGMNANNTCAAYEKKEEEG